MFVVLGLLFDVTLVLFILMNTDVIGAGDIIMFCFLAFSLAGLILIFPARKTKDQKLRRWLIFTGLMAVGVTLSIFLHNLFYALNVLIGEVIIVNQIVTALEVAFFLAGVLICPFLFVVGYIWCIVLLRRRS